MVHKVGRIRFYAIVGFLAFYGLYYVAPLSRLFYLFEPRPKAVVHHSISSPDGKWSAVIYEVAPAPPNRNVSIIPVEQTFSFTEHRSFLNLRGQHDPTVKWLSERVIEVAIPEGEKTYLKYSHVGDVTIEYR